MTARQEPFMPSVAFALAERRLALARVLAVLLLVLSLARFLVGRRLLAFDRVLPFRAGVSCLPPLSCRAFFFFFSGGHQFIDKVKEKVSNHM